MTAGQASLAQARQEIERLRATVTEQAVALHLHEGSQLGLMAGPVPPRVPAEVKAGLLDLADYAIGHGWAAAGHRALGLDHARYWHWAVRRDAGRLEDAPTGGHPLHGLLAWEHAAIVELFEVWGEIGRSRRKLAHRGSRTGLVHVPESTVRRVLAEEGLVLEGPPPREPAPRAPWPDWLEWKPDRIWA